MKVAATADGREPLSDSGAALMTSAARHLFHMDIDVGDLSSSWDADTARPLDTDHLRHAAVQCAVVAPLLDEELSSDKVAAVRRVSAGLGVHEHVLVDLEEITGNHVKQGVSDLLRRTLAFKTGLPAWYEMQRIKQAAETDTLGPELRDRYAHLLDLPAGTVGHELGRYYGSTGFLPPGRKGAMPYEIVGPHDLHHVLGNYDTSGPGEIYLIGFLSGMSRRNPLHYLAFVLLEFHFGIQAGNLGAASLYVDPDVFWTAIERGAASRVDIMQPHWEFLSTLDRELTDVRAEYGIAGAGTVGDDGRYDAAHHRSRPI